MISDSLKIRIKEITKALLFSVALMVLFEAIEFVMSFIAMGVSVIYALTRFFQGDEYYSTRPIMSFATGKDAMMLAALLSVGMVSIVFLIMWIVHAKKYNQLGIRFKAGIAYSVKNLHILLFCMLFVYGMANIICIFYGAFAPDLLKKYDEIAKNLTFDNTLITAIVVVILGPISEELLFRGFILERLSRCMNIYVAIFIQAVLFGIMHGNLVQGSFVIVLGLVSGYLVCAHKSIIPGIIVHAMQNGMSLVLEQLSDEFKNSPVLSAALLIIPFLSIFVLYNHFPRDEYGKLNFKL